MDASLAVRTFCGIASQFLLLRGNTSSCGKIAVTDRGMAPQVPQLGRADFPSMHGNPRIERKAGCRAVYTTLCALYVVGHTTNPNPVRELKRPENAVAGGLFVGDRVRPPAWSSFGSLWPRTDRGVGFVPFDLCWARATFIARDAVKLFAAGVIRCWEGECSVSAALL